MYLGLDLGTSGVTSLLLDNDLAVIRQTYQAIQTTYPRAGWVEQDPNAVLQAVRDVTDRLLQGIRVDPASSCVGFANPGESVLAWDARTGEALTPIMVWSDTRSKEICERWAAQGLNVLARQCSGLQLDPYFCASKLAWLLENDAAVRRVQQEGSLRLCTLDAWLSFKLGGGYLTEHTTASRTQLYDPQRGAWSGELLQAFGIPETALPEIRPSDQPLGTLNLGGHALPWTAALLDQVAALLGNGCLEPGGVKVTYGTGAFVIAQAGEGFKPSGALVRSVGCSASAGRSFILDGGVFSAGSAVQWLVQLGLLTHASEASEMAEQASGDQVRFLPALQGLGAPWWNNSARGVFSGLSGQTTKAELVRAVLDGIASRVTDVLLAMQAELPQLEAVRADGGLAQNHYLMQRQADLSGLVIERSTEHEATALGVALLAGIGAGRLSWADLKARTRAVETFMPRTSVQERAAERERWLHWLQQAAQLGG